MAFVDLGNPHHAADGRAPVPRFTDPGGCFAGTPVVVSGAGLAYMEGAVGGPGHGGGACAGVAPVGNANDHAAANECDGADVGASSTDVAAVERAHGVALRSTRQGGSNPAAYLPLHGSFFDGSRRAHVANVHQRASAPLHAVKGHRSLCEANSGATLTSPLVEGLAHVAACSGADNGEARGGRCAQSVGRDHV